MQTQQTPLVIVYTTSYLPMIGGAELAISHIVRRIPDMRFLIITARHSRSFAAREQRGRVEIVRLGFGLPIDKWLLPVFGFFFGLKRTRQESKVLIWGMMISQGTIAAYYLKRFRPHIPLLITLQEGDSDEYLSHGRWGLIYTWWRRVMKVADGVTVISEYLARRATEAGFRGIAHVIPNGVDETFVSESTEYRDTSELRERLHIRPMDRVLLSVSRLVLKNGLADLIRAHALLRKRGESTVLVLVGDGPEKRMLVRLARDLECSESVVFVGAIDHERLLEYYRLADVFVRPSLSEGLGSVFLEAMGAGVPIVATPIGGINDFLRDGETGVVVRPRDPNDIARGIRSVLEDAALASRLRTSGQELITQHYLWVDIASEMKKVFNEFFMI